MNVLGILGGDPDVRNGFEAVTVRFAIDADASRDDLQALLAQSQKRSAVFDVVTTRPRCSSSWPDRHGPDARMMQTTAVVVGAGHAGLAMSRSLTERSIDHVVLERGEVAHSWRTQRWPSLRLLTPNWQTRLPGHPYTGDDPDGFMPVADVVAALTRYARLVGAPVRTATTVHTLRAAPHGYEPVPEPGRPVGHSRRPRR